MDKRYKPLTAEQFDILSKRVISDLVANSQWSVPEMLRHAKKTLRLTTAEMAERAGVGYRPLQDILLGRSEGHLETYRLVLQSLGLRLAVKRLEDVPPGCQP